MEKMCKDVEQAVAGEDAFPEVGGTVAIGVGRVACAAVVAHIERYKAGAFPLQTGGHPNLIAADGKMHQGPALELEQRFVTIGGRVAGRAVVAILGHGVAHVLGEIGFEFDGGDRQAVDKQDQVDGVVGFVAAIAELAYHATAHLAIAGHGGGVQALGRFELAHLEAGIDMLKPPAQHGQGAIGVEGLGEPFEQHGTAVIAMQAAHFGPFFGLRLAQPVDDIRRIQRQLAVIVAAGACKPAMGRQMGDDLIFEGAFAMFGHTRPLTPCPPCVKSGQHSGARERMSRVAPLRQDRYDSPTGARC
jgi:hypothetical protein